MSNNGTRKKNFDPSKYEWDDENKAKLLDHAKKLDANVLDEILLTKAKEIINEKIKQIHKDRDPVKKSDFFSSVLKLPFIYRTKGGHLESGRNWLGLLLTGIGIVLFWRGIWDGSAYLFSTTASIIIGATILIVMAFIGKRQIFKIFGGE